MTILASAIVDAAQELLQDVSGVAYTTAQGLTWVNKGQRAIVNLRRDAGASTVTWQLSAGAKQDLAATYIQILGDVRNMGTDGTTPGAEVFRVDRTDFGAMDTTWSADANQAVAINEYAFDIDNPTVWWANPPSDGTGYIEASVVQLPADLALESDAITVPDQFESALIHFLCWAWLARDAENSPNYTRAMDHKKSFMDLLGVSGEAKEAVEP